jgi:hypothetical protein
MSNPTTSLEFSRKVYEIIGEQETENRGMSDIKEYCKSTYIPYYTFGELLRVLRNIAMVKGWEEIAIRMLNMANVYQRAPTPEEGMKAVEAYLEQYL